MNDFMTSLEQWLLDAQGVRDRMYRSPSSCECERWQAFWLLAVNSSPIQVAYAAGKTAESPADVVLTEKMIDTTGSGDTFAASFLFHPRQKANCEQRHKYVAESVLRMGGG